MTRYYRKRVAHRFDALGFGTTGVSETHEENRSRTTSPGADRTTQSEQGDREPPAGDEDGPERTGGAESEATQLPLDQVFEVLKNSRRRLTLHYLDANDGTATLSDLAEHIAAIENDTSVDAISSSQRKRVYVGLYQCHLPKMDDMDIVEFDKNRGTIERGPNADQLTPYLDDSASPSWHLLYTGVTGVGVGLFAVSVIGTAPFGLTPSTVLLALLAVMALCSLYHAYVEQGDESTQTQ